MDFNLKGGLGVDFTNGKW